MARFHVEITMEVDTDPEVLAHFAHEQLLRIAAGDPTTMSGLGPDATPQQVADFYAHQPGTVVAAVARAIFENGLGPFQQVFAVGGNTVRATEISA